MIMIIMSILILIVAIALPSMNKQLTPVLFTRISSIVFIYSGALSFNALYIQSIGSGIGIYSKLFYVTYISQLFDTFLLIISFLFLACWLLISDSASKVYHCKNRGVLAIDPKSEEILRIEIKDYPIEYSLIVLFSTLEASLLVSFLDIELSIIFYSIISLNFLFQLTFLIEELNFLRTKYIIQLLRNIKKWILLKVSLRSMMMFVLLLSHFYALYRKINLLLHYLFKEPSFITFGLSGNDSIFGKLNNLSLEYPLLRMIVILVVALLIYLLLIKIFTCIRRLLGSGFVNKSNGKYKKIISLISILLNSKILRILLFTDIYQMIFMNIIEDLDEEEALFKTKIEFEYLNDLGPAEIKNYIKNKIFEKAIDTNEPLIDWFSSAALKNTNGTKLEVDTFMENNLNILQKIQREAQLNKHAFERIRPFIISHKNSQSLTAFPSVIPFSSSASKYDVE
jgi:hypothetical protein